MGKKSNEVTHHVEKPDWMSKASNAAIGSFDSYVGSDSSVSKKQKSENRSVLTQLLSFDEPPQVDVVDENEAFTSSCSKDLSKTQTAFKKKIRLVKSSQPKNKTHISVEAGSTSSSETSLNSKSTVQKTSTSTTLFTILQKELSNEDFREFKRATLNYISPENKKPNASYNLIVRFVQSKMKTKEFAEARNLMAKYIKKDHSDHYARLCSSLK